MEDMIQAANEVEVADLQTEVTPEVETEVQESKPEITETKAFSERLKQSTQKAIDAEYERLYGEYGIKSKADYEAAMERQRVEKEAEEKGIDPTFYQEFNELKSKIGKYESLERMTAQEEALSKDETYGAFFNEHKQAIKEKAQSFSGELKGNLDVAMTLYIKEMFPKLINQTAQKIEQETVKKLINNSNSPGSLSTGTDLQQSGVKNMSDKDFSELLEKVKRGEVKNL